MPYAQSTWGWTFVNEVSGAAVDGNTHTSSCTEYPRPREQHPCHNPPLARRHNDESAAGPAVCPPRPAIRDDPAMPTRPSPLVSTHAHNVHQTQPFTAPSESTHTVDASEQPHHHHTHRHTTHTPLSQPVTTSDRTAAFFNVAQTGHINPTLPLVRQLVSRGWWVVYYLSSDEHVATVTAAGAHGVVVPPLADSSLSSRPSLLDLPGAALDALPWILEHVHSMTPVPSVIVYDVLAKWGGWAATILNIPAVCSSSTFVLDDGDLCSINAKPTAAHCNALTALEQRYGLTIRWEDALTGYGQTNIVYTSASLQPHGTWETSTDRTFHFVGAMLHHQDQPFPITSHSTEANAFINHVKVQRDTVGARNVVFVSMGTAVCTGAKFWRTVTRAFPVESNVLLVCALGRYADTDAAQTYPSGINVLAQRRVPQAALLASGLVDVFVSHGGMNSVHEALYHGVPLVCLPHIGDQIYNANVVQSSGAGVMIDALCVTCTGLVEAVSTVTAPTVRDRVLVLRDTLRDPALGPQAAVAIIEGAASSGQQTS
eukprot:m.12595 g.12595  ORF g.12595 m.12595 type:complete len:542 (+) comp2961_c0_seq1:151-1776(+)